MPFFFPGSSAQSIAAPTRPPSPALVDKLAALSLDEPLPMTYARDRIRLLVQSPRALYLYWELKRDPFATLRRTFAAQVVARYTLMIKLIEIETGNETLYAAPPSRDYWFSIQSGRSYRAEVGLLAPYRPFIRLLSSSVVRTPRAGVAHEADAASEFHTSARDFAQLLDESGYISDALEVALEAVDQAAAVARASVTRTIAGEFSGVAAPILNDEEAHKMRGLLAALALGASFDDLRPTLSGALITWFEAINQKENLNQARLLGILQTMLGFELNRTLFFNAAYENALRRAARVIVGASEVNLPAPPFHFWMPSMTSGHLRKAINTEMMQAPQ
jgi:hypothetical protein